MALSLAKIVILATYKKNALRVFYILITKMKPIIWSTLQDESDSIKSNVETSSVGRNQLHVLVMTESWQGALACIQSFGRRGHHVSVLHSDMMSPHAYSSFVKKRIPFYGTSQIRSQQAEKLLSILRSESVDLVIPISDEDAHILAECKAISPDCKGLVCPTLACIDLARDREKTVNFCHNHGIRTPKSIQVSSHEELLEAASKLGYPMVLKKSYSVTSQGVAIVDKESDFVRLGSLFDNKKTYQAQEFIHGEFLGITGFGWQGELKASFAFRADYNYSHVGTPPYSFAEQDSALVTTLAHIVKNLEWNGAIDLDLLRDDSGNTYLLEINPRLSGTVIFPLKLGIDLPRYYEAALDNSFDQLPPLPSSETPSMFISYPDEVGLISQNPEQNFQKAMKLRETQPFIESLFLDDPGLTRNQFTQILKFAWFTPKKIS